MGRSHEFGWFRRWRESARRQENRRSRRGWYRHAGEVHLRDRGARERRLLERGEQRLDRAAEPALDLAADLGEGEGRAVVLERLELLDPVRGEEVGPRREQLAELRERRPQLGEELPEPHRRAPVGLGQGLALAELDVPAELLLEPRAGEVGAEAVLRHRRRDLTQAVQILERALEHGPRRTVAPGSRGRHADGGAP